MNLTEILHQCVSKNASDLHLASGNPVMLRIDGSLNFLDTKPLSDQEIIDLIFPLLTNSQIEVLKQQMQCDVAISIENLGRFRLNLFYQQHGLSCVFRFIPDNVQTLEQLNVPEVVKQLLNKKQGLILVTGATGSGKSTTLASMVDWLNTHKFGHIITIEDPIEFTYQSKNCLINQREINRSALSYQDALKAALREDPDYLLIGELRDIESIKLALTAAETGHLVLATLHTNSAAKAIDRMIHVFSPNEQPIIRMMLSESLQGILTQRLIKGKNKGRLAAFEVLIATNAIRNLIREDKIPQIHSNLEMGKKDGMQTLKQALDGLYQKGDIHQDECHF